MSPTTPAPAPAPTIDAHHLVALTEVIDRGLDLRRRDRARLIRVRTAPAEGLDGHEIEVGFRPIEADRHPLDELVGFDAPADWAAIGLAATGVAAPTSGDRGRPFPVRSVQLVDRSGAWASRWCPLPESEPDEPAPSTAEAEAEAPSEPPPEGVTTSSVAGDEAPSGRVDDALRRAIGVATGPPPPGGTLLLWTVLWLDSLLATAAASASRRRRRRSLPALIGAHPAVAVLGLDPASLDIDQLVVGGRRLARWRDWGQLRHACATTSWRTPELDAATAAWLDDGSFARWLLGTRPDLDDLHDALAALLVPAAMANIDEALAGWNLLPRHGPPVPDPEGRGQ